MLGGELGSELSGGLRVLPACVRSSPRGAVETSSSSLCQCALGFALPAHTLSGLRFLDQEYTHPRFESQTSDLALRVVTTHVSKREGCAGS